MAEQAKVGLDDGFISALQLCAAAAGDSATAKAIYLAYKVRIHMKHLRTIGGDEHLARLRGEDPSTLQIEGGNSHMLQLSDGHSSAVGPYRKQKQKSFQEREYGRDARTLSAILKACAQACDSNGVGTMWSGRENYGYLDLTSLRLIQEQIKPKFRNTDIPGTSRLEAGVHALIEVDHLRDPRKRTDPDLQKGRRQKYEGLVTLDPGEAYDNLDDLPPGMEEHYFDEEGMLKQEFIDSGKYPEYERYQENEKRLEEEKMETLTQAVDALQIEPGSTEDKDGTPMYYCEDEGKWIVGHPPDGKRVLETAIIKQEIVEDPQVTAGDDTLHLPDGLGNEGNEAEEWFFDPDARKWATQPKNTAMMLESAEKAMGATSEDGVEEAAEEEEWYFDDDERRWKTRAKTLSAKDTIKRGPSLTPYEAKALEDARQNAFESDSESDDDDEFDEEAYKKFLEVSNASSTDLSPPCFFARCRWRAGRVKT